MVAKQSELVSPVRTESGRIALHELFSCVAAPAHSSPGVPIVRINVRSSTNTSDAAATGSSSFDEEHFLSHVRPLAEILNINNMDCVAGLGASASAAAAAASAGGAADDATTATDTYTAVYDALSRLNHACLPGCVHYLEQEEAYQSGQGLERIGTTVTP